MLFKVVTGKAELMDGNLGIGSVIMPITSEQLLQDVIETINQRGGIYGNPYINHKRIADLWSAYLDFPIMPHQAALCMALVKVARLSSTETHDDSIKDFIAYGALYKTILDTQTDKDFGWDD